jgi:protein TonB
MTSASLSPPLKNSLLIHAGIAALALAVTYAPKLSLQFAPTTDIPFDVIEAPRPAAMPLEPRAASRPPAPKSRAVFGLSRKSITSSDAAAPEAKAGNTLAKAEDQTRLRDDDADSLPIPTDDYLVSQMPVLVGDFRVPYPADAKKAGVQGAVLLDLLIDAEGRVRQAQLLKPLFPSLDQAAIEAARKLVFKPARVGDQSVAVRIRYAYRFVLE